MYDSIAYNEINDNYILIDVRSPKEFLDFHIPGALSMPIMDDDERKIVGTLYQHGSHDEAKKMALQFGTKKIGDYHDFIVNNKDRSIVFYCARGGYRSKTVASLFFSLGYHVYQLKGGIKSYRQKINSELPLLLSELELVIMYGKTGSGKSEILNIIKNYYPTLDLEGLANHKGSVLGSVGMGKANSQKMFEALLYEQLTRSSCRRFLVEGESKRIGEVILPKMLWNKMQEGEKIYIDCSLERRIQRLVKEYIYEGDLNEILENLSRIEKFISKEKYQLLIDNLKNGNYDDAATFLCEKYYDLNYKFKPDDKTTVFNGDDSKEAARDILKYLQR